MTGERENATQDTASATQEAPESTSSIGAPAMLGQIAARIGGGALQRKLSNRVQRRASGGAGAPGGGGQAHAAAAAGVEGGGGPLPHGDAIQASFGRHDVSGIQAHVGGAAARASDALGAEAYATDNHVAFRESPSLHTAAHEAAHVLQQQAGVQLKGGLGEAGDSYERHADAVADRVVAGRSAEDLLDAHAGASAGVHGAVQRKGNPITQTPIRDNHYTDLDVSGMGSTMDDEGNFVDESLALHDRVQQDLVQAGQASKEVDVRIAMLTEKIIEAHQRMRGIEGAQRDLNQGAGECNVLGVFTAAEWFFKRPQHPFSEKDKNKVIDTFQRLSSVYTDMVIVPGTIIWKEGGGLFGKTKLNHTCPVLMNGQILKLTQKFLNAGDTQGYGGVDRNTAQEGQMPGSEGANPPSANRRYARGRGQMVGGTGGDARAVVGDSTGFSVGSLNFSIEVCGDHSFNGRARADKAAGNLPATGVDVQIVVSHGAGFAANKSVLKDGGIGIGTDGMAGNMRGTNDARGQRGVYTNNGGNTTKQSGKEGPGDMNDTHMGTFGL